MQNSHPSTGGYFRVYLLSAVNQEDFSRKFKQSFFLRPLTRGGEIPMFARYARVFQQPSSATISLFLPHKVVHLARIFASASFIAVVHFVLIFEHVYPLLLLRYYLGSYSNFVQGKYRLSEHDRMKT